ncbi:MAG TPA: GAF and ANTAR domain-containing protein [Pseudonocardia sp.]
MTLDGLTLSQELAEITRLVEDDDLEVALGRYIQRVVDTVPGCEQASITVLAGGSVETVAGATDDDRDEAELLPDPAGAATAATAVGPIREALTFREPRRIGDVRLDRRWPEFTARIAGRGFRSLLVLPIASESEPAAALTLYSREAGRFADTSYDVVLVFALHAGVVFDNASLYHDSQALVTHLRGALRGRSTIGQAQGVLMHRFGYDVQQAFDALRKASQNLNTKLRDIADGLVVAQAEDRLDPFLAELGVIGPA